MGTATDEPLTRGHKKKARTRQVLLDAALDVLAEQGEQFNVVDVAAAKARGIPVCNIPTYGTAAVAQFTVALLLEMCHHVGAHSDSAYARASGSSRRKMLDCGKNTSSRYTR